MDRLQCPNCGGNRAKITGQERFQEGHLNRFAQLGVALAAWAVAIGIALLILNVEGLIFLFPPATLGINRQILFFGEGAMLALAVVSTMRVFNYNNKNDTRYHFQCALCGYTWNWSPDEPWPSVRVKPQIIESGLIKSKTSPTPYDDWVAYKQAEELVRRKLRHTDSG